MRTFATASSTPLGTVSRVISFLEDEALLIRDDKKQVTAVDWPALLKRWAGDYNVQTSNRLNAYLNPHGLSVLASKLTCLDRYAVTGSMAGPCLSPTKIAMIYVDDADNAARALELLPTDTDANVWLLEPYNEVVFERSRPLPLGTGTQNQTTVIGAAPSQVVVDLMTSPGRGPQQAEALIEEMRGTENDWRRRP